MPMVVTPISVGRGCFRIKVASEATLPLCAVEMFELSHCNQRQQYLE